MSVNFYWSDTHRSTPKKRKDKPEGAKKIWFFKAVIEDADGNRKRVTGTPGVVGPYQDLENSASDAQVAEDRAKREAMFGKPKPAIEVVEAKAEAMTVSEYADTFVENYAPRDDKPSSRSSRKQILGGALIGYFGSMAMDRILQVDVDTYTKARKKKVSPKTINNELGVLSALLGYAHENEEIEEMTSLRLIVKVAKTEDQDIVPVPEKDVAKLVSAATDPRYRAAILLASEAGLRIGEIRGLRHEDIRDRKLVIARAIDTRRNVTTPKGGRRRVIPISDSLAVALQALPRRGETVIGRLDGGVLGYDAMREKIHEIYQAAGVEIPESETGETMPWHSLRHTFGTVCAKRGVPVPQIQKLMGHKKIETTMRYIQVSEADLEQAIGRAFTRSSLGVSEDVRGNEVTGLTADSSTVN